MCIRDSINNPFKKKGIMKYPIGIQSFDKMREDGFVYVDRTALIYKLVSVLSLIHI